VPSHYQPIITPARAAAALRISVTTLAAAGLLAAGTLGWHDLRGVPASASSATSARTSTAKAAKATKAATADADTPAATKGTAPPPDVIDARSTPAPSGPGYRLVAADGGVFSHGWLAHEGSATGLTSSPISGMAQTRDGEGYWLSSADGGVFAMGSATFHGSAVDQTGASPVVDIAAAPGDDGYVLATSNGGVFTFGAVGFHGSAVDQHLNRPIVAVASTRKGDGYWLVSSDGGVFAFGDAPYLGGIADRALHASVISIVPTVSGDGYWLIASDGGVFAFGDATYFGSAVGQHLNRPIVDMAAESSGRGYWLVSADGGVFAFGDAPFLGSAATNRLNAPVIGIEGGVGYDVPVPVADPPAPAPAPVPAPAVAPAAARVTKKGKARAAAPKPEVAMGGQQGWDVSYPQCGAALPAPPFGFGIVGVNGGRTFKHNPCLAEQWRWARQSGAAGIYVNVNFPANPLELALGRASVRQPECNGSVACIAYNYAFNGVTDAMSYAHSSGVDAPFAWLDVEAVNYWTTDRALNAVVLRGAVDAARAAGVDVGIYSTPYQYNRIAGGENMGVPVWSAGAPGFEAAAQYCVSRSFGGGPVALVQLLPGQLDPNLACSGAGPMSRYFRT
jgi:hypothetical protein